jgi:hypothetical protein
MPDRDDFEPLARQWRPVYDRCCDNATSVEVADEGLQVVTMMLRNCGGCEILPELSEVLWHYQEKLAGNNLWTPLAEKAFFQLWTSLDNLARKEANQRVHMVAIRSAQIIALQLQEGIVKPHHFYTLQTHLAGQITKDLIAHCFLDAARAQSIGSRFRTGMEAHLFYDEVMTSLKPGIAKLAKQLVKRPTGKHLRHTPIDSKKYDTRSILHNEDFRLD